MGRSPETPQSRRELVLSILSSAGTLAGLCIAVVAVMNSFDKARSAVSIVDDLFAGCAAFFLLCIYLSFWALKTRHDHVARVLAIVTDVLFLAALTVMTVSAFVMVYTIW